MNFLADKCTFEVLTHDVLSECDPFTFGDDTDMDEFFQKDALVYARSQPYTLPYITA